MFGARVAKVALLMSSNADKSYLRSVLTASPASRTAQVIGKDVSISIPSWKRLTQKSFGNWKSTASHIAMSMVVFTRPILQPTKLWWISPITWQTKLPWKPILH